MKGASDLEEERERPGRVELRREGQRRFDQEALEVAPELGIEGYLLGLHRLVGGELEQVEIVAGKERVQTQIFVEREVLGTELGADRVELVAQRVRQHEAQIAELDSRRSEMRSVELDQQALEHERVEHQLASDIRTLEQRVVELRQQRNTMRTRQSRAEAMTIVHGQGGMGGSEITEIFERWELRVSENEVMGGCVNVPADTLDEEFTSAEEEVCLRLELKELKRPDETPGQEQRR